MPSRAELLQQWVNSQLHSNVNELTLIHKDASFRSYYRVHSNTKSLVVMDAPPEKEDCNSFINVNLGLKHAGVIVPTIIAHDLEHGFMLLDDFGDDYLQKSLNQQSVNHFYQIAMRDIVRMQQNAISFDSDLPIFDDSHITKEYTLFTEWFLDKYLQLDFTPAEKQILSNTLETFKTVFKEQPQAFVHRDYHSRNLMCLNENQLGIIDFQDAMLGPITYDLASLIKDCYIAWPREHVVSWSNDFYQLITQQTPSDFSAQQLLCWLDHTALQRHIKVTGIFTRLRLRDQKPRHFANLPRVLNYISEELVRYPCWSELQQLFEKKIMPKFRELHESDVTCSGPG